MDANSNNDGDAFKRTPRNNYSENSCSSRDGSSSINGGQWHDTRDHRRDHGKNRDRSREVDWNREKIFHGNGKNKENFKGENRERFKEESREGFKEETPQQTVQQQPASFPPYAYNTTDHSCVDNSRRAVPIMPYNLLTPMNNNMPWSINPIDGMQMPPNNMPINPSSTSMPMTAGMEMTQHANSSMNPYASYMGMAGDNMFGMMGMGNFYPYGMMNCQQNILGGTVKELVHLTRCVLYPPKPTDPILTRPRPPGCKTVFVGNLPEKITEEIIREVFERCGEILKIRMNPKSFCHVKFTDEEFVDRALYFSGYRMKIENKDDQPYTGRLHVDYAEARDDAYEYKCKQRAIQREARHRQRQEEECCKVPTPPPVVHYSEHEATVLSDKLRKEDSFQQAVFILITWLERGECNKRNAGSFYSMIQSTSSHVRRLMSEKVKYEDELKIAREMLKNQMQSILLQFTEIEKLFNTASLQKVRDHFTKGQRKNIELWKKQTEEIKNAHVEEVLNDRVEDEMDVSDDEEVKDECAAKETPDTTSDQHNELEEDVNKIKEENDVLRCQLEAAENEMMVLQTDTEQALKSKEHDIQGLMQALQKTTNILNLKRTSASDETELKEHTFKSKRIMDKDDHQDGNNNDQSEIDNTGPFNTTSFSMCISETDARLLGLISTFLHVHPFGANIDYICSYLHQIDSSIQPRDVESLMKRFPSIYVEELTGIGASLGKKWRFLGFQ